MEKKIVALPAWLIWAGLTTALPASAEAAILKIKFSGYATSFDDPTFVGPQISLTVLADMSLAKTAYTSTPLDKAPSASFDLGVLTPMVPQAFVGWLNIAGVRTSVAIDSVIRTFNNDLILTDGPEFFSDGAYSEIEVYGRLASGGIVYASSISYGDFGEFWQSDFSDPILHGGQGYASVDRDYGMDPFRITGVVSGIVPEPTSWLTMLSGFGMIGGAMRYRRKAAVSFR